MGEVRPFPKSQQLARGERRYRRKVASPKQWQAIIAAKQGPCRICRDPASNGSVHSSIQFHHVVSREDHGDDVEDNIVPLCQPCHDLVTRRDKWLGRLLMSALSDAEYAYMIDKGGEDYPERAYGVRPSVNAAEARSFMAALNTLLTVGERDKAEIARLADRAVCFNELRLWVAQHVGSIDLEDVDADVAQVLSSLDFIVLGNAGCTEEGDYTPEQWRVLQLCAVLAGEEDARP